MKPSLQQFGDRSWTQDKLSRLRKYLEAYAIIMRRKRFEFTYIDAFAGTGYHELKLPSNQEQCLFPEMGEPEIRQFLDGSARVALQADPAFNGYVFIEKDGEKSAELEKLRKQIS